MERRTPLKRTGFKNRGQGLKRTGRVKPRSDRNVAEGAERKEIRTTAAPARCTIGPVLAELGVAGGCDGRGRVEGLHERRKASSGGSKVNEANLMPACNRCNSLIECEPKLVRERTGTLLVVREGDPEWEQLGRRHDRFR